MQLVGEVLGQVSDTLNKAGVWGFDETSVVGNVGRDLIEAGGTAAIAAATGGNVGAAAASAIAGNVATAGLGGLIAQGALAVTDGQKNDLAVGITNIGLNITAAAAGAAAGAAVGGGAAGMDGAAISSSLNEYNGGADKLAEKLVEGAVKVASKVNPEAGEALDSKIDETLEAGDKVIKDVMDPINEAGEAAEDKLSEWINKGVNTVEKELETGGNTEIPALGDTTQNTPSPDDNVSSGNDDSSDPNLTVHQGKQNKHIPGTNENTTANASSNWPRSTIDEGVDPQKLVNQYAGTGEQVGNIPRGQLGFKERIRTDHNIGQYYDKDNGGFVPTQNFIIHYSKNDVHIVPASP